MRDITYFCSSGDQAHQRLVLVHVARIRHLFVDEHEILALVESIGTNTLFEYVKLEIDRLKRRDSAVLKIEQEMKEQGSENGALLENVLNRLKDTIGYEGARLESFVSKFMVGCGVNHLISLGYRIEQPDFSHSNGEYLVAVIENDDVRFEIEIGNSQAHIKKIDFVSELKEKFFDVSLHKEETPQPESSFRVGQVNSETDIRSLVSINGISIENLERIMRPRGTIDVTDLANRGAVVDSGYLGKDESLIDLLAEDNRTVVDVLGTNHEQIAHDLFILQSVGYLIIGADQVEKEVVFKGANLLVRQVQRSVSNTASPFRDGTGGRQDLLVINTHTGKQIFFSELHPHMIQRYGFYEGRGCSYRLNPEDVIALFQEIAVE